MSLRAVVEIVVHLESFRNIDLFFQGIYYTRVRVNSKRKQQGLPAGTPAPKTAPSAEPSAAAQQS